jgi:hypothetical protein
MSTFTLQLPTEKADQLVQEAERLGVRVEELLERITDDFLARKESFEAAAQYVLRKNAELYRRLAK